VCSTPSWTLKTSFMVSVVERHDPALCDQWLLPAFACTALVQGALRPALARWRNGEPTATLYAEDVGAMIASHGCGASWVQRGSQTGHCCGCHRTFSSEDAFDMHRSDTPDMRVCADPADCKRPDGSPAFVQKHDGHSVIWMRARPDLARPTYWRPEHEASKARTALPLVSVPDLPQTAPEGRASSALGVLLPV